MSELTPHPETHSFVAGWLGVGLIRALTYSHFVFVSQALINMAKRLKVKDLINLSKSELLEKEKALKDELFKLNAQRYSGRVEKPHLFSLVKRELAAVETTLNTKKK